MSENLSDANQLTAVIQPDEKFFNMPQNSLVLLADQRPAFARLMYYLPTSAKFAIMQTCKDLKRIVPEFDEGLRVWKVELRSKKEYPEYFFDSDAALNVVFPFTLEEMSDDKLKFLDRVQHRIEKITIHQEVLSKFYDRLKLTGLTSIHITGRQSFKKPGGCRLNRISTFLIQDNAATLTTLEFEYLDIPRGLKIAEKLPKLKRLDVEGCLEVHGGNMFLFSIIKMASASLNELGINGVREPYDLSFLEDAPEMESLTKINATFITGTLGLKTLIAKSNQLKSLTLCAVFDLLGQNIVETELPHLKALDLMQVTFDSNSIHTLLLNIPNVKYISLYNCGFKDLNFQCQLGHLKILKVQWTYGIIPTFIQSATSLEVRINFY